MPWLYTVNAKILIRDSIIEIGDHCRREKIVKIQGPQFIEYPHHKLILHPTTPKPTIKHKIPDSDSSKDDSSDSGESDSEFSSDDDIIESIKAIRVSKKSGN